MTTLVPSCFIGISSFLQETKTCIKSWMISNFHPIPPLIAELAVLIVSENLMYNLVSTLASSFLIGSSSFL